VSRTRESAPSAARDAAKRDTAAVYLPPVGEGREQYSAAADVIQRSVSRGAPEVFVLDVDGVMTTGQFLYSETGKAFKIFGPHDADGLRLICNHMPVRFISADLRGFEITRRRIVEDLGYPLDLVGEDEREAWFAANVGFDRAAFMGDGLFDAPILKQCVYGIAPSSARPEARAAADFVTPSAAGCGAVLDACLHLMEVFCASC
jgi:3-deoxy-D-manno-octulosonate 8-phosphate phosphatase (KDO 8-P phosphatase)